MEQVYILLFIISSALTTLAQNGRQTLAPPPSLGHPYETITNKTMDEIITGTMGGVGVASNMILADDGHILAELDMYLTKEQFLSMYAPPDPDYMIKKSKREASPDSYNHLTDYHEDYKGSGIRTKRKAARSTNLRWTNAEIPYLFARGHFEEKEEYLMRRAMTEWERYTCLKFRPATSKDKNSVRFQNGVGCNSQLGMIGGIQVLNLQAPGCRYKGLYLHEIGHAVGLVHEHQLPDRDKYISINYENVDPIMRVWFNKYTTKEVNQMDVPYEYSSVMHYGITAFASDGKSQTIRAHDQSKEKTIGLVYLKELAYTDVQIVNLMYNCSNHCTNQNRCGPDGHLDENCKCICKDGSSDCDNSRAKSKDNCVNNYDSWSCYIWANQGECERNPLYMKQQCAKACGSCGSDATSTLAGGSCKDVYAQSKCQMWKERGDCATNERWMKSNCKATCQLCGDSATTSQVNCKNQHTEETKCEDWAKEGECSVNAKWMFENCRKSCGMCAVTETEVDSGGEDVGGDEDKMVCENTNPTCQRWADSGECQSNPSWMITNCRQACKKCDDGTCKNFYDDVQCQIWAQKLECLTNADWMAKHCAKECGRGICEGVDPKIETTTALTGRRSTTTAVIGRKSTTRGTVTTATAASCKNVHKSDMECDIWARNDHCSINPSWMLKNCALSCKVCSRGDIDGGKMTTTTAENGKTGTGEICEDSEAACVMWGKSGFCDSNPGYNLIYCKKSCNNCNGCRDTNFLCGIWEKDGQCLKNARYMLRNCQKSCKTCPMYNDDSLGNGSRNYFTCTHLLMASFLQYIIYIICRKLCFC